MAEGFFVEQVDGVTVHTFTQSSDDAVDLWFNSAVSVIEGNERFTILLDVSAKQVSFTGYARQKSRELFTRYRHRQGRFAFLFSSKTAPHYARIFFASLGRLGFELQFFSNREKALSWLREK
jgi:hypothetical protein